MLMLGLYQIKLHLKWSILQSERKKGLERVKGNIRDGRDRRVTDKLYHNYMHSLYTVKEK